MCANHVIAAALIDDLENNAAWRRDKAAQYPDDERNVRAAEISERLMDEAAQLGADDVRLRRLEVLSQNLCGDGLELVQDINEHHRAIGFGYSPASISEYLDDLIGIYQRCTKRPTLKVVERRVIEVSE
jgi:hypothetical protein